MTTRSRLFRIRIPTISIVGTVLMALVIYGPAIAQDRSDPSKVNFVTTDIDNFWRAYDLAQKETDNRAKAAVYQREYIDKGSDGLKGFMRGRIQSAEHLVDVIGSHATYYESIRQTTLQIAKYKNQMQRSFRKLKEIYPEAAFPDVYFVIGCLNSGGTTSSSAIIIGAEMNSIRPDTPRNELSNWLKVNIKSVEGVPYIVAHELIHIQQNYPEPKTLLSKSLQEGSADLIGELISGRISNPVQKAYGEAHHAELWKEFRAEMDGSDWSKWLFNGDRAVGRPADLGYYIGYAISRAFYKTARDKRQAIKELLELKDPNDLLRRSGYDG